MRGRGGKAKCGMQSAKGKMQSAERTRGGMQSAKGKMQSAERTRGGMQSAKGKMQSAERGARRGKGKVEMDGPE
jgi:hypothetical protein